ncbi:MAG: DUF6607 family protein [Bacteroidota bacterium]
MKNIATGILVVLVMAAYGQSKKKQDVSAILGMCGCYDVSFSFAETFGMDKDYEYHDNYYSGALEWAFPVSQEKDKIVIQHLLVIGDSMIIKHWRQDWSYENQDLYIYDKDNTWKYKELPSSEVKGQWTQKVFQVDDSPRYEGSASWVHVDGRHYWEAKADAPLPRREKSKRKDYNVMGRRNRHEITQNGWVHEQDNLKIVRAESDQILASEKGWNTYNKVDESKCQLAKDWWKKNNQYWADVRNVWDEVFASQKTLSINMMVDNQIMFMRLFGLGGEVEGKIYNSKETQQKIRKIIQKHLASDSEIKVASN